MSRSLYGCPDCGEETMTGVGCNACGSCCCDGTDCLKAGITRAENDLAEARDVARRLLAGLRETATIWEYDWLGDYPWLSETD